MKKIVFMMVAMLTVAINSQGHSGERRSTCKRHDKESRVAQDCLLQV